MTRKDYVLIASAFSAAKFALETDEKRGILVTGEYAFSECVERMAQVLARGNQKFDRRRFLAAAGVEV